MTNSLTRREFLKIKALTAGVIFLNPVRSLLPEEDQVEPLGIGRVTVDAIGVYAEPSFKSERLDWRHRDELLNIIDSFVSSEGPRWNPKWYRVVGGYAHSAYLQRVESASLNQPLNSIPGKGLLGEVTVPFSQSYLPTGKKKWQKLYRLYFGSVFWITQIVEGPDGEPWYGLVDDRLRVRYDVPAAHMRPIPWEKYIPIHSNVPSEEKHILVSISDQELFAFEGKQQVYRAQLSSGIPSRDASPNGIPTDTPLGKFYISLKMPSRHMGDGNLTEDYSAYELPGVPWVSIFHSYGIGFHGTYWHNNFGNRMSHGCINLRNEDALWLYRWTTPIVPYGKWYRQGRGTLVQIV
jgi:L,D-transpeptidase catalytic domain